MSVTLDCKYKWKRENIGEYVVNYIGNFSILNESLNKIIKLGGDISKNNVNSILNNINGSFAVIMESQRFVVAITDRIGSYPVFYTTIGDTLISNSAYKLSNSLNHKEWKKFSIEEFSMAGYVTGADTLIKGVSRLQSAEILVLNKNNNKINIQRYYRYMPLQDNTRRDEDWVDELDSVFENIVHRIIDKAKGRPIIVPLSAGLDSRLLVTKLHEHGYDNLKTFSYGPIGNWESKGAKEIAGRLNLPWELVTTSRREAYKMFWGFERKQYWSFADGLSALPSFQDYYTISKLHSSGKVQSGDFITGGHIPESITKSNSNIQTLLNSIIDKHYSIWKNIITEDRRHRVHDKIVKLLDIDIKENYTVEELCSLYECWEYEERQVKWVIHGQRIYDFFGYDWQLPFWDNELVDFYRRVPLHLKQDQLLYKKWLTRWDYNKLFSEFNPVVWRWPGSTLFVVPIAKIIELMFDDDAKRQWYELFYYWGHRIE